MKFSDLTIISGGQTGVDRAALDFAKEHDIARGGWCPKGRKAEDGRIPEKYPLTESKIDSYGIKTLNIAVLKKGSLLGIIIIYFLG
ncbi:MAG: putative molybdenum carrier protein [Bacteroidales bacterium]|nr:putative molybdenum carrier protein [Bacteroidales bacterium]